MQMAVARCVISFIFGLLMLVVISTTMCKHEAYSEPTCTEPSKCLECEREKGDPLGHTWVNGECTVCGEVEA